MCFDADIETTASALLQACRERGATLALAESCTGGLIAAALTAIAGASDVVERGFVTYSNAAKREMLGVAASTLIRHGAVSREVAAAMAAGALARSHATLALAVTGIAGPGGGSADKPVGLVCFAIAGKKRPLFSEARQFTDAGRAAIRLASLRHGLALLSQALIGSS
ncbi:MAG: CinA family protein [Pseudomonadota bacterium]